MSRPLLAFYGATGGSTLACLVPALKDSYDCLALVRTPSKLTTLLLEKGVPQSTIDTHLHITQGDVLNPSDVRASLTLNNRTPDIIFSGIGIYSLGLSQPVTICADGIRNILDALREIKPVSKPMIVALSSTGITRGEEKDDLPWLMKPLYYLALHAPHADKMNMEDLIVEEAEKGGEGVIGGYILPRASMLTNGASRGLDKIRDGTAEEPAVGYTISRDDVGLWMFEKVVKGERGMLEGKKVTLTY